MPQYFKPWRRKIGVVTLVMACGFAGMWVRNQTIGTEIAFGIHENNDGKAFVTYYNIQKKGWFSDNIETTVLYQFISRNGLSWRKLEVTNTGNLIGYPIGWRETNYDAFNTFFSPAGYLRRWQLCGFDFGECRDEFASVDNLMPSDPGFRMSYWTFPCWSIVIPLTLLSVWLLLSKPRVAKTKTGSIP